MNRFHAIAITAGLICSGVGSVHAERPPNIVLIVVDDMGWRDLSHFNSDFYETPNIDRIAKEGMRFTDAYSPAANCAPSRASIYKGQYTPRHGVYTVGPADRWDRGSKLWGTRVAEGPNRDERILYAPENAKSVGTEGETIGTAMKKAGYQTGYFGKWHQGWGGDIAVGGYPEEVRGFDDKALSWGRHYKIRVWPEPDEPIANDVYLSDYLTDRALQFIENNQNQPFFLFFADFLVHIPQDAPKELVEKFKNKPAGEEHEDPVYAAMVAAHDRNVGRILNKLDELGLSENTLVLFTSDNGGDTRTSNDPFRGFKGMFLEGGLRVPFLARWPGIIDPGRVESTPVIGVDLFPTVADIANSPVMEDPEVILDGQSLRPLFTAEMDKWQERDLFWYYPGYLPGRLAPCAVIRSGHYKLTHFFEDDSVTLYNLEQDPGERNDLAGSDPEKAAELKARLDKWRKETGAEIPPKNPNPIVGPMRLGFPPWPEYDPKDHAE